MMSGSAKRKVSEDTNDIGNAVENKRQKLSETADTAEDSRSQCTRDIDGDVEAAKQVLGSSFDTTKDFQEEKTNETDSDPEGQREFGYDEGGDRDADKDSLDEWLELINAAAASPKEPPRENIQDIASDTQGQRALDLARSEGYDTDRGLSEHPPKLRDIERTTKEAASKEFEVGRSDTSDEPGPAKKPSDPRQCSWFPYSPPPTRITQIFRSFKQEIADITRARYAYCDPALVHLRPRESYLDTAEDRRIAGLMESVKLDVQELELRMLKAKEMIELKDKTKAEEIEVGHRLRDTLGPRGETYARLKTNVDCEVKMLHARLKTLHEHLGLDKIQDYWYSTYRPVEQ